MTLGANRLFLLVCTATVIVTAGTTAGAASTNVDIELNVGATLTASPGGLAGQPTFVPNGSTVPMTRRNFVVHVDVSLITAAPGGRPKVRLELGGGLRWGVDAPDPTEGCASTPTTGECQAPVDLQPLPGQSGGGWYWDVVAPGNGAYTFRAELFDLAQPDPVPTNNSSMITIVVNEEAGGGGASGGGDGGSVALEVGAARLSPAKPTAGAPVVVSVRVARGGSAVRPTGVTCAAAIGKAKLAGAARAASGVASCRFATPRSAKGKLLAGSVTFRAGGQQFVKRFSTRLG